MSSVSPEKITQILDTIDKALVMHNKWYEDLVRSLLCRTAMPESFIATDAHRKCDFGSWFYKNKESGFKDLPSFTKIEELHKTMHDSAREICLKIKANGMVKAEDYDYFVRNLTYFREELSDFRQRVVDTLAHVST